MATAALAATPSGPSTEPSSTSATSEAGPDLRSRWGIVAVRDLPVLPALHAALAKAEPDKKILAPEEVAAAAAAADVAGNVVETLDAFLSETDRYRLAYEMDAAIGVAEEAVKLANESLLVFYRPEKLAEVLLALAVVQVESGAAADGRASLVSALHAYPALELDPGRFSPPLLKLHAEVSGRAGVPAPPTLAELTRLGVGLHLEALVMVEVEHRAPSELLGCYLYDIADDGSIHLREVANELVTEDVVAASGRLVAKLLPAKSVGGTGVDEPGSDGGAGKTSLPLGVLPDPVPGRPLYKRPLFWGIVGGGAVVAGGLAVLLSLVELLVVDLEFRLPEKI